MKIAILGGSGTLGHIYAEFLKDNEVTIFSRNEYLQWKMKKKYPDFNYILGDICNYEDVSKAIQGNPVVLHLCAVKHVATGENQPDLTIRVNIEGTQNVIKACLEHDVKKAVYFNTDKAIKPINTYGATKYLAYKLWENANKQKDVFSTIVSGNIINSSGSVLEIYRNMIKEGKTELPLTHENVERFWITKKELCDLLAYVLQVKGSIVASHQMIRFKISDLIDALGCKQSITGLTMGEKIREDFFFEEQDLKPLLTVEEIKKLLEEV